MIPIPIATPDHPGGGGRPASPPLRAGGTTIRPILRHSPSALPDFAAAAERSAHCHAACWRSPRGWVRLGRPAGDRPILQTAPPLPRAVCEVPRTVGTAELAVKTRAGATVTDRLRTSGALRILFPAVPPRLEGIVVNTGGGLTGGDRLSLSARVGVGGHLTLTTQAAERVYRAASGEARVVSHATVVAGAHLSWLPQETILYDGAALSRRLRIDLDADATLLLAEPVVFGRRAMGERLDAARLTDRIAVHRDGVPLYLDGVTLSGDIDARLARGAVGGGAGAMASVLYVAPDAEARLADIRAALPDTAGASLLAADILVLRFLAGDGFDLRTHLVPVLDRLSRGTLPASWRL